MKTGNVSPSTTLSFTWVPIQCFSKYCDCLFSFFFSSLLEGIMWEPSRGVCDILALCATFGLLRDTGLRLSEENLSRSLWAEGLCRWRRVRLDGQNDGKYIFQEFNLVSERFALDLHERFNESSEGQTVYLAFYRFKLHVVLVDDMKTRNWINCWQMCPWVQIYPRLSCREIISFDDWLVKITFHFKWKQKLERD